MTETGAVLGTLQYMAPEQVEGRPSDARTDIFAFGAVLFEMMTGRRAFDGASTAALMAAILREEPPAVHPRGIDRIVKRCLQKDPLRRYQSTRDLVNDLDEVKGDLGSGALAVVVATPVQTLARRRAAWWLVPVLVGAAVAIAGYRWSGSSEPSSAGVARYQLQPPSGVEVQAAGPNSVLAISPDGRWIAFRAVSSKPDQTGLYLRSIGDLEPKQIAPAGVVPFFSPDSRWLGFVAESAMYRVPVGGGRPDRICLLPNVLSVRGASWSEEGTIVFSLDRALWRVSAAGGTPAQVTHPAANARHYWPQVLPGGAAAVFTANEGYNDRWRRIALAVLKTGEVRPLADLPGTVARYVPTGHLVFSRFGALHAVPFDVSRLEVTGTPVKVLDDVHTFAGSGSVLFDVSASGSLVFSPGSDLFPDAELLWRNRDGTTARFDTEKKPYIGAAIDPSGTRLAVAIASVFGEGDLWVLDLGSGARSQLTTGMHAWSEIVWSPDGKWIYFTSFKSGEAEIYRVPSAGGDPLALTSTADSWAHPSSVSPDGKTLLYWRTTTSQSDLMTLPLEPLGTPSPVTDSSRFSELLARFAPSGRWMAYVSDEAGSTQVYVRSFPGPGAGFRVSPDGGTNPWWSGDGRALFYQRGREIWMVPVNIGRAATFQPGAPRVIVKEGLPERSGITFLPVEIGGRFIIYRRDWPERRLVYVPNWLDEMKQTLRNNR
jgi:Tol biopolymer transport system component